MKAVLPLLLTGLQGGPDRVFDGYVIRKPTGDQIVVSNPAPHFGFVIQSRFR